MKQVGFYFSYFQTMNVYFTAAVDTVYKLRKFIIILFWQKFRESNGFDKEITKELISRFL